ncbi:MAG: DUF368 domain-containing protein [Pseudomonadota bacterium]
MKEAYVERRRDWVLLFCKGFAMGAANVVPGVSGGTVAFVTGIYERLINALKSFDTNGFSLLLKGQFKALLTHVDFWFLFTLGVGVIASVFTLAKLLAIGFERYPVYLAALFFGLIFASVFSVGKRVKVWTLSTVIALSIGLVFAVGLTFAPTATENTSFVYLMLCGMVAMCSMIIPGVSGSFVLLLMGNYQLIMIETVNGLRAGDFAMAVPILLPVAAGAVIGLIVLSRFLSWLFRRHHDNAVAVITGFVAGSLVIIWPWKSPGELINNNGEQKILSYVNQLPDLDLSFGLALIIMAAGAILLLAVDKLGSAH